MLTEPRRGQTSLERHVVQLGISPEQPLQITNPAAIRAHILNVLGRLSNSHQLIRQLPSGRQICVHASSVRIALLASAPAKHPSIDVRVLG